MWDVFWFGLNAGDAKTDFYPQFWKLLKKFGYRPHWGKVLPPLSDYRESLPKLDDFLALRRQLDPKDIFLTEYWKTSLGL